MSLAKAGQALRDCGPFPFQTCLILFQSNKTGTILPIAIGINLISAWRDSITFQAYEAVPFELQRKLIDEYSKTAKEEFA